MTLDQLAAAAPAPLVPEDVDLRSFTYIPFDIAWLVDSDFAITASGEGFKTAITLLARSWGQIPAGSLPDDDRMLAHLAGFGRGDAALAQWSLVKDEALTDFVLCSDGRFYSRSLAGRTLEAWNSKVSQKGRTEAARKARQEKREAGSVTSSVTDTVTGSRGDERRGEGIIGKGTVGYGKTRDKSERLGNAVIPHRPTSPKPVLLPAYPDEDGFDESPF